MVTKNEMKDFVYRVKAMETMNVKRVEDEIKQIKIQAKREIEERKAIIKNIKESSKLKIASFKEAV